MHPAIAIAPACSKESAAGFGMKFLPPTTSSASDPFRRAEDLVSRAEIGDVLADRLDDAGEVDARRALLRLQHPEHGTSEPRGAPHRVPVGRVDRCGAHPDEHVVGADNGRIDLLEPKHVGRAENVLDDSFHTYSVS